MSRMMVLMTSHENKYPVAMARAVSHLCSQMVHAEYAQTAQITSFQDQSAERPPRYSWSRSPATAGSPQNRSSSHVPATGEGREVMPSLLWELRDFATSS